MIISVGKPLWMEDDALTWDRERLSSAYLRLFDEVFDHDKAIMKVDEGDCVWYAMPNGIVVCTSYPGNSAIYEGPLINE